MSLIALTLLATDGPLSKAKKEIVDLKVFKDYKDPKVTKEYPDLKEQMVRHSISISLMLIQFLAVVLVKQILIKPILVCTKTSMPKIAKIHKTIVGLSGKVVMDETVFQENRGQTDVRLTFILPMPIVLMVEQVSV